MGCGQSKMIENEEAVTRCKERKQLMKAAVTARNAFAAAHSAYAMALKNTGAALSDYAHGEFLVSGSHYHSAATTIAASSSVPTVISPPSPPPPPPPISNSAAAGEIPQPITDTLPPPPPPPPLPLQRAATMPEMNGRSGGHSGNGLNGIEEDGTLDSDSDSELENHDRLIRKSKSNRGGNRKMEEETAPPPPPANSRPIPPPLQNQHHHQQHQEQPFFDYIFPNVEHTPGTTLEDNPPSPQPQVATKPESLPHSEEEEEEDDDDDDDDSEEEEEVEETVVKPKQTAEEKPKRVVEEVVAEFTDLRIPTMTAKKNLSNVFNELDDHFLKASESAHEVSKMLEATRLHYHSNFADNRGTILIRSFVHKMILALIG